MTINWYLAYFSVESNLVVKQSPCERVLGKDILICTNNKIISNQLQDKHR